MQPFSAKLVSALKSDDPELVREAILAVSELNDPRYMQYVTPLFRHKNVGIRYFAKKVAEALSLLPPLTLVPDDADFESGPEKTSDELPMNSMRPCGDIEPESGNVEQPNIEEPPKHQAIPGRNEEAGQDFDVRSIFHKNRQRPNYGAMKKSMGRSSQKEEDDFLLPPVPQTAFEKKTMPAKAPPETTSPRTAVPRTNTAQSSPPGTFQRTGLRETPASNITKRGTRSLETVSKTSAPVSGKLQEEEEDYIEEMLMKLDSQSSQDRLEGIFNLKRIRSEEVAISLLELAEREKDPLVLSVIVKVLPELAPFSESRAFNCLKASLKSEDQRIRANAVESLEKFWKEHWESRHEHEVFQLCLPLIQDSDNRVKANALKLFFCFNRDKVLLDLAEMLRSGDIWMRDSALYSLGEIKDEGVIPLLLEAVSDANEEIRLKAYKKLAETGRKNALIPLVDKFIAALDDEAHELHYIANMVLRKLIETVSAGEDENNEAAEVLQAASMPSAAAGLSIAPEIAEALLSSGYWNFSNLNEMVNILISSGQARMALSLLESLDTNISESPQLMAKFAELNLLAGHFTKAMEVYERLVATAPDNPVFIYKLGEIYLINCMYDKALATLEKAVESSSIKTHPRRLLATTSLKKGLVRRAYKEAMLTCEAASVELPPEIRANVLTELSVFFEEAGELETSVSILEKLSETCAADDITFRIEATRNKIHDKNRAAAEDNLQSGTDDSVDSHLGSPISNLEEFKTKVLSDRTLEVIETAPTGPLKIESEPDTGYLDLFEDPEVSLLTKTSFAPQNQETDADIPDNLLRDILSRLDTRYINPKIIGKGGMGVVFKAKDSKLGREVALKVLPEHLCIDDEIFARFLREAQAAAQLNHFNIVGIYDIVTQEGFAYIVMEFVDGFNLRQLLKRKDRIPVPQLKEIGKQLITAFICAHDRGVIHRDIKPDNIMINSSGVVKIMDFGLAKADFSETITRVGIVMGTSFYMAPEQIKGQAVGKSTDIYSIGITLYELLTGKPPFTKGNVSYQHIHVEPDPPGKIVEGLSGSIDAVIMKCLAKEAADRYSDCRELLRDWNEVL